MIRTISVLASVAALLMSSAAMAQDDGEILLGASAFGNWQDDAPGVQRLIAPDDLEPPNIQQSASNSPETVDRPAGATPLVPDGFAVELVAEGIANPRAIEFAPNGDLFVPNSESNEILVYRFADGAAEPTEHAIFASGLNQPYGIAFYPAESPQWVYVANADSIVRFPYADGDLEASGQPEVIVEGIPSEHHWTRDIAFSPDGSTLYLSVGSGSNVGENMNREPPGTVAEWAAAHPLGVAWGPEQRRAAVLAFNPDGSNERYVATGLRNCAGLTVQPETGALWCVVNERDELGDNVPFEYATEVKDGAFYGWPWYYIGDNEDPRWANVRPDLADQVTIPDVLFQAHSAPLNIAFYQGDAFGAGYDGDAFVAMHGSWNRGTRTGYKVVRLDFEGGKPTGVYEDFMTGFVISDTDVWGRPVGVAIAPDGDLFVSEDGAGTIWRVSRAE